MPDDVAKLLVQVDASVSLLKTNLAAAERQVGDFQRDVDRRMRGVDQSFSGAGRGLDSLGTSVGRLKSTLGGFAAGAFTGVIASLSSGAITNAIRNSVEFADAIGDTAERLGVGTKFLQEFEFAAISTDSSIEGARTALEKFNAKAGDSLNGSKAATAEFAKLGVSILDAGGKAKSTEALFLETATAIAALPNQLQRTDAARAVFGKGASELLPLLSGGAEGFARLASEANNAGAVLSGPTLQAVGEAAKAQEQLNRVIAVEQAKVVAGNTEAMVAYSRAVASIPIAIGNGIGLLDRFFKRMNDIAEAGRRISPLGGLLRNAGLQGPIANDPYASGKKPFDITPRSSTGVFFPAPVTDFLKPQGGLRAIPRNPNGSLRGVAGAFGAGGSAGLSNINFALVLAELERAQPLLAEVRDQIEKTVKPSVKLNDEAEALVATYRRQNELAALRAEGRDREADQSEALARVSDEVAGIEGLSIAQRTELLRVMTLITIEGQRQRDAIADQLAISERLNDTLDRDLDELSKTTTEPVNDAIEDYRRKRLETEEFLAGTFESLFRGGFKAVLRDLEAEAIRILSRLAAQALLGEGGGSGGGGLLGGIISGIGTIFAPGRERGGPVTAGQPYIVGEKRPELFVPRVNGDIIPNLNALRGGGSNVSISIDARGAVEGTAAQIEAAMARYAPMIVRAAEDRTIDRLSRETL
jgi:hypothetical protein